MENKTCDSIIKDNYNEEITFNNQYGNLIAKLSCPLIEAGYGGHDIVKENRSYKINGLSYGVDLWLGSQLQLENNSEPLTNKLAAIFMHCNNFDTGEIITLAEAADVSADSECLNKKIIDKIKKSN